MNVPDRKGRHVVRTVREHEDQIMGYSDQGVMKREIAGRAVDVST